jgi:hypothetical protein
MQTESVDAAVAAASTQYAAIRSRNASEFARLDAQRTADLAVRPKGPVCSTWPGLAGRAC